MKNLNKKIGAVSLAAMMAVGGLVIGARQVHAAPAGFGPSLVRLPHLRDYQFVKDLCDSKGIEILKSSIDSKEIDSHIAKNLKNHLKRDPDLIKKLEDVEIILDNDEKQNLEQYLESLRKDNSKRKLHRFKFGHNEYLILVKAK